MSGQSTPGPWALSELCQSGSFTNDGGFAVMGGDGDRVAVVYCRSAYKRGEGWKAQCAERDANARLIAAAPDLLAALQRIEGYCSGTGDSRNAVLDQARAAIARATGDEQ